MKPERLEKHDNTGQDQTDGRRILTGTNLTTFIKTVIEEMRKETTNNQCTKQGS